MRKKAQAAMEFLMTYGWAILVVLAAIAALAYFGILNPGRFLPDKCQLPSGFACMDWKATSIPAADNFDITVIIKNGKGSDLTGVSLGINAQDCKPTTPAGTAFDSDKLEFVWSDVGSGSPIAYGVPVTNGAEVILGIICGNYHGTSPADQATINAAGDGLLIANRKLSGDMKLIYSLSQEQGGMPHTVYGDFTTKVE